MSETDGPDLTEAYAILAGTSARPPELRHLEALNEERECQLITLAAKLKELETFVMNL